MMLELSLAMCKRAQLGTRGMRHGVGMDGQSKGKHLLSSVVAGQDREYTGYQVTDVRTLNKLKNSLHIMIMLMKGRRGQEILLVCGVSMIFTRTGNYRNLTLRY